MKAKVKTQQQVATTNARLTKPLTKKVRTRSNGYDGVTNEEEIAIIRRAFRDAEKIKAGKLKGRPIEFLLAELEQERLKNGH